MAIALLDVNVLVALYDTDHVHHDLAHDWFADQRPDGWATCATTEKGFVRVLSNPSYGASTARPVDLLDVLRLFCASGRHHYWQDTVSMRDKRLFNPSLIRGHRQVTDVYLLGLAVKSGGWLATFDSSIPLKSVVGARRDALQIISAG